MEALEERKEPQLELSLRAGDRVRLTPEGVRCYGGVWPHFIPEGQGAGAPGTVLVAGERPHKPGAAPRPYYVRWDNGVENSYRVEDLEADEPRELEPGGQDDPEPSNIVPFLRPRRPGAK
jgi:hypothetical protein